MIFKKINIEFVRINKRSRLDKLFDDRHNRDLTYIFHHSHVHTTAAFDHNENLRLFRRRVATTTWGF